MLEISAARRILHGKSHFLESHSPVVVLSEDLNARLLQRAKEASLARSFIIVAHAVVLAVPRGLGLQKFHRLEKNAQIILRHRLITLFLLRRRWREQGTLLPFRDRGTLQR
jgi:hypothetical protein